MQANPDKFQALAIGKKTFKEHVCFDLNGSKIKCEEHVKQIEPCGTPLYTVSKELQIFFTFTHYFLPDK
jgi:hypothetical protein